MLETLLSYLNAGFYIKHYIKVCEIQLELFTFIFYSDHNIRKFLGSLLFESQCLILHLQHVHIYISVASTMSYVYTEYKVKFVESELAMYVAEDIGHSTGKPDFYSLSRLLKVLLMSHTWPRRVVASQIVIICNSNMPNDTIPMAMRLLLNHSTAAVRQPVV